jgi:outer membrane receptor protein involved in Fe transport
VPGSSIGGVTVYTGGIPAKYGDTTGGVIILETKSYFDLYREWKIAMSRQ